MTLTAGEQASLNFYEWEVRGRGWNLYENPIHIEPPYEFFNHSRYQTNTSVNDGRAPSVFGLLMGQFNSPKQTIQEEPKSEPLPQYLTLDELPKLVGFSLLFPHDQEIRSEVCTEFISMLSFTSHPVSFEIVGSCDDICIQLVCSSEDQAHIRAHIRAYFPTVILKDIDPSTFKFNSQLEVAISDFGFDDIFMQPMRVVDSLTIDPLTSVIANMEHLEPTDVSIFQIIFKGVANPWSSQIKRSVSDGQGGSFFIDEPNVPRYAHEKTSHPLFSVVMRIASQGSTKERSQYLASQLIWSITSASTSEMNKLIPLSNKGYPYEFHLFNLKQRTTNRTGFIVNSKELATFVHYPNKTVISNKLGLQSGKTKQVPSEFINEKYTLGINVHNNQESRVSLDDQTRLRHTHIIGATGVGKSTLLANMLIEDMKSGNGCCLFDPHGDIVEDILARVPDSRINDVILIDPANLDYPIGFNLLHAETEAERIVLSSDLVSAFKRYATAWGDNMSAVLQQAVNAFLESSKGGTLIELKRFLLEDTFRDNFLQTVDDPSIHYYWQHEYQMVRKGIAPLLTRIDTFLRPKTIRYMLAQQQGVDFRACIEEKKIVLIKLSQGLIGEENSFLLGSLFLSKFNQVAMGRQSLPKEQRHPFYIYCDEFQNFVTNSITSILSGARKYGLGLILAHQELSQIDDMKVLNSVISNPNIRICFRLGDVDAKKLENGFSYFEQDDLQSLGIGQAIMRIGSSKNDFNLTTFPLEEMSSSKANATRKAIVDNTIRRYTKTKAEVEEILETLLPKISKKTKESNPAEELASVEIEDEPSSFVTPESRGQTQITQDTNFEQQKQSYIQQTEEKQLISKHRTLQNYVKTIGIQRGYVATIEDNIEGGGRVDVSLKKDTIAIAVEVSVTNTIDYEIQNILKCLQAGYAQIFMVSESRIHLKNIGERVNNIIQKKQQDTVAYLLPSELISALDSLSETPKESNVKTVRGYRIKSNHRDVDVTSAKDKNESLKNIILSQLKKRKK